MAKLSSYSQPSIRFFAYIFLADVLLEISSDNIESCPKSSFCGDFVYARKIYFDWKPSSSLE